jgi:glucokinase
VDAIRYRIGIDMGASNVRIGLLDAKGAVVGRRRADIRGLKSESAATLRFIRAEAEAVAVEVRLTPRDIGFIGLGVPGTVDDTGQGVAFAPNLGWRNVHVGKTFPGFPWAPLAIVQDTRAAAFAEYLLGAGRREAIVVCITVGTGIGGGIVMDGKVYHGAFNTSGEIGHIIIQQQDGLPCSCGQTGCLETVSSGTAIVNAARRAWGTTGDDPLSAEQVFQKARDGDAAARDIIARAARCLGVGIVNLVNLLSPNVVVLSGGMCAQEELFIEPVREFVLAHAYSLIVGTQGLRVAKAMLGEDAPMIGAGMMHQAS